LFFFHYIFSFFFTVLVVQPRHDNHVTTVLTHYSLMAWYSFFCAESAVKHQPTNCMYVNPNAAMVLLLTSCLQRCKQRIFSHSTNYFYAVRISISSAILSEICIQIGYFF